LGEVIFSDPIVTKDVRDLGWAELRFELTCSDGDQFDVVDVEVLEHRARSSSRPCGRCPLRKAASMLSNIKKRVPSPSTNECFIDRRSSMGSAPAAMRVVAVDAVS
jgi:hypothetical protein